MAHDAREPKQADGDNQIVMTGPNNAPMRSVPCGCNANTAISTMTDRGSTYGANEGRGPFRSSSTLNTEIGGVIAPSP